MNLNGIGYHVPPIGVNVFTISVAVVVVAESYTAIVGVLEALATKIPMRSPERGVTFALAEIFFGEPATEMGAAIGLYPLPSVGLLIVARPGVVHRFEIGLRIARPVGFFLRLRNFALLHDLRAVAVGVAIV